MKLYTLKAKTYQNKEGKALAVTSSRTGQIICLFQQWFTPELLYLYQRVWLVQKAENNILWVDVPFSQQEVNYLWNRFNHQQASRGIKPYRG